MSALLDASVSELKTIMARGEASPLEVVDAHIARIEEVNDALNALVAERFEAARAEARRAGERMVGPGPHPPLLGVPCTIKEFIRVEGMPHTAGIPARADYVAGHDAEVVRRLKSAGAVVLGVSNVPEGGMWMETHNRLTGRTNNPWDLRRTSGGSSGGEGALVAAGCVPFGIGSDVGGSIRIPAAFCGTIGHKPTGGLVPNTGQWPDDFRIGRFLTTGPLSRRVDDADAVLRVIAGPDAVNPTCGAASPWPALDAYDPREVTVFALEGDTRRKVRPEMVDAVHRAADALVDAGARRGTLPPDLFADAFRIWSSMVTRAGAAKYVDLLGDGDPISTGRELVKLILGRSGHTLPAVITAALEKATEPFEGTAQKAVAAGLALRERFETLVGPRGVLIYPPYTRPAPLHLEALRTPFDFLCTGLFNVLELPGTVVPVSRAGDLPVSVQVVGARGADGLTLAMARQLERAFGGWRRAEPEFADPLPRVVRRLARRLAARADIRVR